MLGQGVDDIVGLTDGGKGPGHPAQDDLTGLFGVAIPRSLGMIMATVDAVPSRAFNTAVCGGVRMKWVEAPAGFQNLVPAGWRKRRWPAF